MRTRQTRTKAQTPTTTQTTDRDGRIRTAFREGVATDQIALLTGLSKRRVQEIVRPVRQ